MTPMKEVRQINGRCGKYNLRLHGAVAQNLGLRIVSGQLKPGLPLDGDIEASENLGVSRSAYREGLRILNAKGLVHSRPYVGTRISMPEAWHLLDPDILSWMGKLSPNEKRLIDLFELQKIVEPHAAALAAARRNDDQLEDMWRALEDMRTHTLATEAGRLADRQFHTALLHASDNPFLVTFASAMLTAIKWTRAHKEREISASRELLPGYEQLVRAIAARNSRKAHRTMLDLLRIAQRD